MKIPLTVLILISALSASAENSSKRPDWLSGESSTYPKSAYILGIGEAYNKEKAADKARTEIAKSFSLSLSAKTKTSARESSDGGYAQDVSDDVRTSTAKVLDGVEIAQYWKDEKGAHYALAVLNRDHSLKILRDKLDEFDQEFKDASENLAKAEGKFSRLKHALKLVQTAKSRKKTNADYRVLNPEGKSLPVPAGSNEVLGQARKAISALAIQVEAAGPDSEMVATRLIDGLSDYGFKATEKNSKTADILIEAKTGGEMLPPENLMYFWAKGSLAVKMSYGATGDVFTRFEDSGQQASGDPEQALAETLKTLAAKSAGRIYQIVTTSELSDE